MTDEPSKRTLLRERMAATAEADRFAVVSCFGKTPMGARELAERSGIDVARVRYFLRGWLASRIVEKVDGDPKAAAAKYRLRPSGLVIQDRDAEGLSAERLNEARTRALGLTLRQAMALAAEGRYGEEGNHTAFKMPIAVDDGGLTAAVKLHERAIDSIAALCDEAGKRLRGGGVEPIAATACIAFSERVHVSHAVLDKINLAELAPKGRGPRNIKLPGAWEDPLRYEIEFLLLIKPYTVAELVAELGVSASSVRRALAGLEARGAAFVEGLKETRGTAEKRYSGNPLAKVELPTPGVSGDQERKDYEQFQIRVVAREMLAAGRAGRLGAGPAAFAWMPVTVDREGYEAIGTVVDSLCYDVLDFRDECLERRCWEAPDHLSTICALLYFRHE